MRLTRKEREFIERRRKFVRTWPIVGAALLVVVFFAGVWMWQSNPLLVDPWAASAALKSHAIPDSAVTLMAAMLPLVMITCLFILVVDLLFIFAAFSNERKHIEIIQRLIRDPDAPEDRNMSDENAQ